VTLSRTERPLFEHQKITVNASQKTDRLFDMSDPGTGKTRAHLEAWSIRRKEGGKCLLVIAPKSLLEPAWGNDIEEFTPDFTYSVAYANNREKAFAAEADIYITNTDAVKWLALKKPAFFEKFDSIVIDESTAFKHRTSGRSKALNKIKKYFKYRAALTGTPNSNSITEIWNQVFFLDDGKRLSTKFFAFRNQVCTPTQVGAQAHMIKWTDRPGSLEAVTGLIKDISVRHNIDECMDLPENIDRYIKFNLNPAHLVKYIKMEKDAFLKLEDGNVDAVNAAVLRNKLLQIASGAVYTEGGEYTLLDSKRYELVTDLAQERENTVVFFLWRHQKEQLIKEADKRGISFEVIDGTVPVRRRKLIVDAFQAGFFKELLIHPKTGAHGLTLTKGRATIWPSPIYEPELFKQGKHRIVRSGQEKKTENLMVLATGTVEKNVYETFSGKNTKMVNFLDLINYCQNERSDDNE